MKIGINGFGRIGRTFLRTIIEDPVAMESLQVAAINVGPAPLDAVAYALKYDSVMGTLPARVMTREQTLYIDDYQIPLITELDPKNIGWDKYGVDWVVEATGLFTHKEKAEGHFAGGAQHVLITAPAVDEDVTIILGVNDEKYEKGKHRIVSLGSCTTNALVPMLDVLHEKFNVEHGYMTTVHAYTTSQSLLDTMNKKLRRGRAAPLNIVPTTTGATKVLGKILPELADKIGGISLRVPVAKGSLVDLTVTLQKEVTVDSLHEAFRNAIAQADGAILDLTMEPLVSTDINGNNHSVVIDGLSTAVVAGHTAKILGWYDNEWGYCQRLKDFLMYTAQ